MSNDPSRRDFLRTAGLGAATFVVGNRTRLFGSASSPRIGVQLYSVRKALEKDFDGTVKKLEAIGFAGVEYYPLPENVSDEHAARLFKEHNLTVLGLHTPLPAGDEREHAVWLAHLFGTSRVIFPGWPEGDTYATRDAIRKTAESYNTAAEYLASHGLLLGLHNHWWEFESHDGVVPFPYLLKNLDPRVFFELDVYWVQTGGQDPASVVREFGRRAPLLHIKDGPAVKGKDQNTQVPSGKGKVDIAGVVQAARPTAEWLIVEFDEYEGDIFDGLRQSFAYVSGLLG
jgi:sugar phosphate isomerase/epimerase